MEMCGISLKRQIGSGLYAPRELKWYTNDQVQWPGGGGGGGWSVTSSDLLSDYKTVPITF